MWRYLAGGLAALLLVAAGVLLFKSPARSDTVLPAAPLARATTAGDPESLPDSVPEASPRTREEKRFGRYDKDRNALITREEYLVSRRKAFAKLDVNRDGQLSFDEWAVKTTAKFAAADRDKSGSMTATEFATTAPKRKAKAQVKCPPVAHTTSADEET